MDTGVMRMNEIIRVVALKNAQTGSETVKPATVIKTGRVVIISREYRETQGNEN